MVVGRDRIDSISDKYEKSIYMPAVSLRYLVGPVDEQGVALDLNVVLQSSLVPQKVLHQGNILGWKDQSQKT